MSAKKGKSTSKSKGKKKKVTPVAPPADLPPDPILIAIQARKDGKSKRQEAHKLCQQYIKELQQEIEVDIRPYREYRDDEYRAIKVRFANEATAYAQHLAATQRQLDARHHRLLQKLSSELSRVRDFRQDLGKKLADLEYLRDVKEGQKNTIGTLKKQLDTAREEQAEGAQRIRLRHAKHRLIDLEGREHRLEILSEHLAKETLPYFVYRLKIKMDENRRLRADVLRRVNEVKLLNKFRAELDAKDKMLAFDYQHLLKYRQNTSAMLKRLAISPVPTAPMERDFLMSPHGVRGWSWRQPSMAPLPVEDTRPSTASKSFMKSDDLNKEEKMDDSSQCPIFDQQPQDDLVPRQSAEEN
ncbi:hypothetical protein RvY_00014 [Ramazzottius varieornatus]|uniref:DUF4515 domain-containing protein n=1 Tax=Ramazzottius varieornatus TaxID=947166 RepID=A0A1D1UIP5_RAMVA|nr:hypothetical protein RvY_00014 [Ramazzottius varieornatus]